MFKEVISPQGSQFNISLRADVWMQFNPNLGNPGRVRQREREKEEIFQTGL